METERQEGEVTTELLLFSTWKKKERKKYCLKLQKSRDEIEIFFKQQITQTRPYILLSNIQGFPAGEQKCCSSVMIPEGPK